VLFWTGDQILEWYVAAQRMSEAARSIG
jgi:hypothetical protein